MKKKIFALTAVSVMLFGVLFNGEASAKPQVSRLVSLLPASDVVAVFNAKRFLNDALPKVLATNQPLLGQITGTIAEMEAKTGIDLRKFDQVAVGVRVVPDSLKLEPVAIASGDINAGALLAVAKLASNGSYREEKIGDKMVYIFSAPDAAKKAPAGSKSTNVFDEAIAGFMKEVAVTATDSNTLVMGTLPRLREALGGKSKVSADIVSLLAPMGSSVATFAAKPPVSLGRFLPVDNDELGKNVDSIEYLSGSMDVNATGAAVSMLARTRQPEQAKGLRETLEGLQMLGKAIFSNSKRADQQVYGRLIGGAKFTHRGNDLLLDLTVSQSDIDLLVGRK